MDLNTEEILLLIKEYEKHKVLWDAKDKWHYSKIRKQDAWNEIGKIFNADSEEIKQKIVSLLGSLRREKLKIKNSMGTGKGATEVYKSNWFAFSSFAFLMDKDEPRKRINSEQINDKTAESSEVEHVDESFDITFGTENSAQMSVAESTENADNIPITSCAKPSTPRQKRARTTVQKEEHKKRKETVHQDPRIQQAFEILQQPIESQDFISTYSRYLEQKLKQFYPRMAAILIHKINQLIFENKMNTACSYSTLRPSSTTSFITSVSTPSPTYEILNLPGQEQSKNIPNTSNELSSISFISSPPPICEIINLQHEEQSKNIPNTSNEVFEELNFVRSH